MDMTERIFELVDETFKEQKDFAAALDVTPSIVSEWRRGKSKSYGKYLPQIAAALDTTVDYLLTGQGPKHPAAPLPAGAQPLDPGVFRRIPILGRISAGLPLYAEQQIEGYTVTDLNGGAEYFALIVHGDSMDALGIKDGYRIIVRRQDDVENGEVAVVMVGREDATVKRFYASGDMVTLVPQSTNPQHRPQIYDTHTIPVRVIGKVVKVEFSL